jgi:putative Mn2+ efflux pump MntP
MTPELVALSAALAVDAAAAAATVAAAGASRRELVRASLVFGAFQAGMAGAGAAVGTVGETMLGAALPWGAGATLVVLGAWIAWGSGDDDDPLHVGTWSAALALGLATSIDALAAGVVLPLWPVPVAASIATIGTITTAASLAGGVAGASIAGRLDGPWAARIAGLVLVLLGLRTLWLALG